MAREFKFPFEEKHTYNKICCNCGFRNGEHYGQDRCEGAANNEPYHGTYFKDSGRFAEKRGVKHWDVLKHTGDPNILFKMRQS